MQSGFKRAAHRHGPRLSLGERSGVRSLRQLSADMAELVRAGIRGKRLADTPWSAPA
jgi:hypothetical protein